MPSISSKALQSVFLSIPVALAAVSTLQAQQAPGAPAIVATAASETNAAAVTPSVLDEVVVTGTRAANITQAESPAPVQILSPQALQAASGNPDLLATLAQIVPSLNAEIHGGDMESNTLQLKLRGLNPNDVLVLVNGKRRHTTANLGIDAGPYQGGAGVDLNFIPLDAIDHIEVLTDGAAAQYGSDAIAGVINIILKTNSSGGDVQGTYGGYYDGGGHTGDVDGNAGFQPGNGYFNISGSDHNHGTALRNGPDPRAVSTSEIATYPNSNMTLLPDYPYIN
jgi:iron complex outermembrane recepter protein